MYISIEEAQGQLLDLVRRAEAGEEVLLTHEGRTVAKIDAVAQPKESAWSKMTPEDRLNTIRAVVARAPRKRDGDLDAAHCADFLYDEGGMPA